MTAAFLQSEQGDAAFRKLMSSPVNAPRKRIKRVKVEIAESIDSAGKSLADIYRGRCKPYRGPLSYPLPTYRQWLNSRMDAACAAREDARAKQEWADRRAGLYSKAAKRRRSQIASGILQALPVAAVIPEPLPVRKPTVRKSRSTFPSYREQQIAACVAAGEWTFLAEMGRPSIAPNPNLLLLTFRTADVITFPAPVEYRAAA